MTLDRHTSGEVASLVGRSQYLESPLPRGRTGVGDLVELYLGKLPDNSPEPDFPDLGVEVKSLPMKRLRRSSWTVKEPTSLSMIDFNKLVKEDWATTPLRRKIDRILWVPYEHNSADKRESRFRRSFLWSPPSEDIPAYEADYRAVRALVLAGKAHEISERLSLVLSARRKGATGEATRSQPGTLVKAKSRAWAFKVAYTRPILEVYVLRASAVSIVEHVAEIRQLVEVLPYVEGKLRQYEGKALAEIGAINPGKSGPVMLVRQLLRLPKKGKITEFEKLGVRVHTVWARASDLLPWEAVSFPAMVLKEFCEEEWEDSALLDHLDRILFLPLLSDSRQGQRRLGRPFIWSPSKDELKGIEREWSRFKELTQSGLASYTITAKGRRRTQLPTMTETQFIHMRPHGRNARDTDVDFQGNVITKQCFWLNKDYLQAILKQHQVASVT